MPPSLLDEYRQSLTGKAAGTVDNYLRALTALTAWIATQPGSDGQFQPEHLTRTALQTYLDQLGRDGYSPSHRNLVKSAASSFADWLIDERGLLARNPARRIQIEAQPLLAPRVLSPEQRYVLKNLVERADDRRGEALFALGYCAGCRVSDVSHLRRDNVHLRARSGWVKVGYKGNKMRSIDLSRHPSLAAGWSLEEIAYYLGHTTKRGTPALQTTVRYTQASREQVRDKLRLIEG